jgi:hypothetical protein
MGGASISSMRKLEIAMDLVFIGLGVGMFAAFAGYAVLLRRI